MANDKPQTSDGYSSGKTEDCERLLITLLGKMGPYRDHVRVIGGLCPRYLCPAAPPNVPEHFGTQDVDLVLDVVLLHQPDAYKNLAQNLHQMGFKKGLSDDLSRSVSWRWEIEIEDRGSLLLEFLCDLPPGENPGIKSIQDTAVTAMAMPHVGMALGWYDQREVTAELLREGGLRTETVRFADIVSFITLKALAFSQRTEPKDAADLAHVLTYFRPTLDETAAHFKSRLNEGLHNDAIAKGLTILRKDFTTTDEREGWRKSGAVAAAKFFLGDDAAREDLNIRQREVADLMARFLAITDQFEN